MSTDTARDLRLQGHGPEDSGGVEMESRIVLGCKGRSRRESIIKSLPGHSVERRIRRFLHPAKCSQLGGG
jgi:hypothetical protein